MPKPAIFENNLVLPVIAAPMFLISGPELVIAACKAGVVGSFPATNARTIEELDLWLDKITSELENYKKENPCERVAPFAVNLIVHSINSRMEQELELIEKYKVPFVITSVGHPGVAVKRLKNQATIIFHDVITLKHAQKAIDGGVDGLILVCAGAGGHTGWINPFAFSSQVREIWNGPMVISGSISDGRSIRAVEALGADFAYMGSRFLSTEESMAESDYKEMLKDGVADNIITSNLFSGMNANWLTLSLEKVGLDPANLDSAAVSKANIIPWKDIYSVGHGVGTIHDSPAVAELVDRLLLEYEAARNT